jgi:hypothetical protein
MLLTGNSGSVPDTVVSRISFPALTPNQLSIGDIGVCPKAGNFTNHANTLLSNSYILFGIY